MKFLFKISFFALLFCSFNCKKDPVNCVDEKVGDLFFTKTTVDFLPLTGSEKLIFKDANGSEMLFQCTSPAVSRFNCNVEKLCEDFNLAARFKYLEADTKSLKFTTNSSIAIVSFDLNMTTKNAILKTATNTALFDDFSCTFFDGTVGGSQISRVLDQRNSSAADLAPTLAAQTFRTLADTVILGKSFMDLTVGSPFFGNPVNSKSVVFYQKNKGVAAFSLADGRVFVFDRAE